MFGWGDLHENPKKTPSINEQLLPIQEKVCERLELGKIHVTWIKSLSPTCFHEVIGFQNN